MIGTTLAHYRITASLGSGGMGEVWRAEDTRLGREVALKVLPEEHLDHQDRIERFEREARAVAALNHPHIVTIFSVEDADGVRFLTMELVEGSSLDRLIPVEGLDVETFFDLATPLAEAISAAHDKSVIHRDLKPSNVMVDGDGRVKVMDFGLAKLQGSGEISDSSELPTEALTGVGMVVGTVPYMSPEQVEGKIVDHRTDVFSLGVLLYEMATGDRPFRGESSVGLMSSILRDRPPSVVAKRVDFPNHLGRIINRCLEKDRRDRYQTARDVFIELKALRSEASAVGHARPPVVTPARTEQRASTSTSQIRRSDVPWIAVLPFGCPTGDGELEAFADGLEEDIASGLSRFSYLFVVARKSTGRYRGEAVDVRQVGEDLGARFVMEGGIRKAGSTIRINVQIVDTETGTHLWAESFDRDLDEAAIFAIQDDITDRVVATVADPYGVVARSMAIPTAAMEPQEMTAYQAVLRYFLYQQRLSREDHLIAREALERAVEIEPGYADAWSCLALVVLDEDRHDFNRRPDALDRALSAARRGVDSDPASSFSYYALATVYFYRRDLGAFRANAEKAIKLNRRNGNVVAMLGVLYGYSGDWDRGVELTTEAMKLNPHHPGWYRFTTFFNNYLKGNYEEALRIAQKINMPGYYAAPLVELLAHHRLGNTTAAENAAREMLRAYPADDMRDYGRFAQMWWYSQPDLLNEVIGDLRSVGVEVDSPESEVSEPAPVSSTSTPTASQNSAATETQQVAIAVLPFSDLSPAKDQGYFGDGLSEEIINALTRLPGLRVIARTSAFRFRGEQDLRLVGEELGVRNVLEGSVRRAGQRLRITAQLIEAADQSQIWSERFDREMTDVFEIQDEIAATIVEKLNVSLAASEPARRQTTNVAAYDALLEGRHHFSQFTPESTERALGCFRRALSLDPDYPDALAFYAFYHLTMAYMFEDPREMLPHTRSFAERALQSDPHHGEAQAAVAVAAVLLDRDWSAGEHLFRRALELAPASARVHELYGLCCLLGQGRFDEALTELDLAIKLDPLSALYAGNRGRVLTCSRRFAEAQESCRRGLILDPEQLLVQVELTYALLFDGQYDDAITVGKRAVEAHGLVNAPRQALALSFALSGRRAEAFELVTETAEPNAGYRSPLARGLVHAAFAEMDEAFESVEQSLQERDPLLMYLAVHPMFDGLRHDPRYPNLLTRMNLVRGDTV